MTDRADVTFVAKEYHQRTVAPLRLMSGMSLPPFRPHRYAGGR